MKLSVCIATYNGERYLAEQLASVLAQLGPDDEVVVVDDASTDSTVAILDGFSDARIKVHRNERNRGVVFSFDRAMRLATGDVLFLCDQDDRWLGDRVQLMLGAMVRTGALLVSSNSAYMDARGGASDYRFHRLSAADSRRHVKNIADIFAGRAAYFGCAMALCRRLNDLVLPMPGFVESHDLWIAMAANLMGSNVHMEENTLVRRVHGENASIVRRALSKKVRSRVVFALSLLVLLLRRARLRGSIPLGRHGMNLGN